MSPSDFPRTPDHAAGSWAIGLAALTPIDFRLGRTLFAATMIGLGVIGLIQGDFALVWQRIPIEHLPGRSFFAYASAAIELLAGIGLLIRRTARPASAVLAVFLLLWLVLLKVPAVVVVPSMEATWLGFGEIAVLFAGGWMLHAIEARAARGATRVARGVRAMCAARVLFALSLPMIGLSHFFYVRETSAFVPGWLPFPAGWAYLTGAGSIAACLGILFGVWPRLAAMLEAAMLTIITLLVWGPKLFIAPPDRTSWTGFTISLAIAAGAWVIADSYRAIGWRATQPLWRR